jgi:hypothetical protein
MAWGDNASFKNARAMISGPMPQGSPGVIAMADKVDINGFGLKRLEMSVLKSDLSVSIWHKVYCDPTPNECERFKFRPQCEP